MPPKSPTWELTDGSIISGSKLHQASPDSLSIPWLLLRKVDGSAKGNMLPVTFIQRLNTNGGLAPADANQRKKGQLLQVNYTAEYLFYR